MKKGKFLLIYEEQINRKITTIQQKVGKDRKGRHHRTGIKMSFKDVKIYSTLFITNKCKLKLQRDRNFHLQIGICDTHSLV